MYCPKCGAKEDDQALFCSRCGTRLPTPTGAPEQPTVLAPTTISRLVPERLTMEQYDHPLDRQALAQVRKLGPVVTIVKLMIQNWDEPMVRANLLGGSVLVSDTQFPEISRIVRDCAAILNMPAPEVFIKQDPYLNAATFGVNRPFIILHSSLVDALTTDELYDVIGHEMGHIKSEHVLYLSAAYFLTQQAARLAQTLFGIGSLITGPARMALIRWQRQSELTADRAGLICAQSIDVSVRAMAKLALGSRTLADKINLDDFMRQGQAESGETFTRLTESALNHPLVGNRIREMATFFNSDHYRGLMEQAIPLADWRPMAGATATAGADPLEGGRDQQAEAALRRGLAILQRQGMTLRGIFGTLTGDQRQLDQALHEFELACVLDPTGETGLAGRYYSGMTLVYLGQVTQARALLTQLREEHPEHHYGQQASAMLKRLA